MTSLRDQIRRLRCVQAGWAFGVPEDGREWWLDEVTAVLARALPGDRETRAHMDAWQAGLESHPGEADEEIIRRVALLIDQLEARAAELAADAEDSRHAILSRSVSDTLGATVGTLRRILAGEITDDELQPEQPQRSGEWDGTQAGCVMHRQAVTWDPAPAWWHHAGEEPCPYLIDAPAPLPRDKPWICGRYGERGKPQSYYGGAAIPGG